MSVDEFNGSETIRAWYRSARFERDDPDLVNQKIRLVLDFCAFVDREPDQLVSEMFRTDKAGDTALSAKRRDAANVSIEEYVHELGLDVAECRLRGNIIRSFLVHNGVFIQGSPVGSGGRA